MPVETDDGACAHVHNKGGCPTLLVTTAGINKLITLWLRQVVLRVVLPDRPQQLPAAVLPQALPQVWYCLGVSLHITVVSVDPADDLGVGAGSKSVAGVCLENAL